VRLAEEAEAHDAAARWAALAGRGAAAFTERLFTGAWFRVDTDGPLSEACFVEQLFGPFLARRLGLGDIVAEEHARTALRAIHAINFRDEGGGEGAVSLARVPGAARAALPHRADTSFQTAEIQPGFNFSLAAQLDAWGLGDEAADLRRALARELDRRNLSFQTPAAFDRGRDTARAVMNMRPLAAWWAAPFRVEAGQAPASDRQRSTRPR
jgi:non-lysosomal glucosylceramidase